MAVPCWGGALISHGTGGRLPDVSPGRTAERRRVVLIVEPAEFTRHRLRAALRAPDREIHVAATASEGLSALATLQPRLIVLSLELPDLSGLEVVERFVRRVDGAAIVVVGPPSVPEVVASIRRGASDYLNIQDVDAIPDAVARVLEEPVPPRPRPEHRGGRDRP